MARSESSLTKQDAWNLNGLVNSAHPSAEWAERRIRGALTAETSETVRQHTGDVTLILPRNGKGNTFATEERATIDKYLKDDANKADVDAVRARFRAEAQAQLDAGTYGAGTRGPAATPARVMAILQVVVAYAAAKGSTWEIPEDREVRIATADVVEHSPKYRHLRKQIEAAVAPFASAKTADLSVLDNVLAA